MAALANMYNRWFDRSADEQSVEAETSTKVRAFANEDVFFYTKRIDNSGVVRTADPKARGVCWKLIGSAGAAVVLLIGVLLPGAYSLLAGYKIQALEQEQTRLLAEQASLELQEAQLLSPARMEDLARQQQFIDPPAAKVQYLDGAQGSLAMNRK